MVKGEQRQLLEKQEELEDIVMKTWILFFGGGG